MWSSGSVTELSFNIHTCVRGAAGPSRTIAPSGSLPGQGDSLDYGVGSITYFDLRPTVSVNPSTPGVYQR